MARDCACDRCAEAAQPGANDDYLEVSHVLFLHPTFQDLLAKHL